MSQSKSRLIWASSVALAFAVGLLVGMWAWKPADPASADGEPTGSGGLSRMAHEPLTAVGQAARGGGAGRKVPAISPNPLLLSDEAPEPAVESEPAGSISVPVKFANRFGLNAFDTGFLKGGEVRLSQNVVEFLNINDAEKSDVEALVTRLATEFRQYETQNVERIADSDSGRVTLEVSVSEDFGESISNSLENGLIDILGENRGAAFNVISESYTRMIVGGPDQRKRLTFVPRSDGDFDIRVEIEYPGGGGSTYSVSSQGDDLPPQIKHLASLREG